MEAVLAVLADIFGTLLMALTFGRYKGRNTPGVDMGDAGFKDEDAPATQS